jgi:hypothetical protein
MFIVCKTVLNNRNKIKAAHNSKRGKVTAQRGATRDLAQIK